jgi:tetratricopeptide (TPR) repeat protein
LPGAGGIPLPGSGSVPLPGAGGIPLPGSGAVPLPGAPVPGFGATAGFATAGLTGAVPLPGAIPAGVPLPGSGAVPLPGAFGMPGLDGAVPIPGGPSLGGPPPPPLPTPGFGGLPGAPPPPVGSMGDIFGADLPTPVASSGNKKAATMADIFGDLGGNPASSTPSAFHGDNSVVVAPAPQTLGGGGLLDFIDDAGKADGALKQEQYRVRKRSGRVLGPFETQVVLQMFARGELLGSEEGSTDGVNWKPLGQIPAFAETIQKAMASALGGLDDLPAAKSARKSDVAPIADELQVGTTDLMKAEKAKEEIERRRRDAGEGKKRKALVAVSAASVLGVVGVIGAGLNFGTPYGWFGYKFFFPDAVEGPSAPVDVVEALPPLPSFGDEVDPQVLRLRDHYAGYRQGAEQFARVVEARKAITPFPDDGKKAAAEQARFLAYLLVVEDIAAFAKPLQEALALAAGGDELSLAVANAGALYAQGKWDEGITVLKPFVDPARSLKGNVLAEMLVWTGLGLRGKGALEDAMKRFDEALQADVHSALALSMQAAASARAGGREFALDYADKALAENPDHARAAILKGSLLIAESKTLEEGRTLLTDMSEGARSRFASPGQQAEAFMGRAELAMGARAYPEAMRHLNSAVALVPQNRTLRARAVEFAIRLREYSVAREHAKALLAMSPDDPAGTIGLARAKLGTRDTLGAFTDLQAALKKRPDDAMLNFWFGIAARDMGKLAEAHAQFEKAAKLDPKRADPVVENVLEAIERGKLSDALQIADASVNGVDAGERFRVRSAKALAFARRRQFTEAEEEFKKALAENPRDSDTRARFAELLVAMKRLPDAEAQVDEALKMDGKNPTVLLASGAIAEARGELKQARDRYEEAMQMAPNAFEPYARAAVVASRLKDQPRARSLVETASQLRPMNPDVVAAQAVVTAVSDPKQATQMLTTAAEASPEDPRIPYLLGQTFQSMGANLEAIDALKKATTLAPEFGDAWFTLGKVNRDLGRNGDAKAAFAAVIRVEPNRADAWVETADILAAGNDDAAALDAYEKAIRAEPNNPSSICAMGDTLVVRMGEESKNLKRGVELLERCVKLNAKHATAWKNLGNAYKTVNRKKEAAVAYKQHLTNNPDDPENAIIRDLLEDVGGKAD